VLKRALVIDVLNTHDVKLARRLYEFLNPGDVLLGDRAFCSYADLVFVKNRQAVCEAWCASSIAVFRKHQGRKQDLRRGKIVGSHDKQVVWHKLQNCPKGLTKEEFLRLPKTLIVREIHSLLYCYSWFSDATSFFNHYFIRYKNLLHLRVSETL
jgi:hypothetical protein